MYTIIALIQNYFQSLMDIIFKQVVRLLRKVLFSFFQPVLIKKRNEIGKRIINDEKLKQNPNTEGLSILNLTSISNFMGVVANNSFEYFFIAIPDIYGVQLEKFKFKKNGEFDSTSKYYTKLSDFLAKSYHFSTEEVYNLISTHAECVAKQFLEDVKAGRQKSNNMMFGVDKILNRGRVLELHLFVTDYFSYTCMNRIYRHLKREFPHNNSLQIKTIDDVNRVSPFLCNFGVGGFLSLNYAEKEVYFVGKRSSTVACPNVWQTSFDETFDLRDRPNLQGASPNLKTCLERGVKEELGFLINEHDFRIETSILSVIQTEERFEIELFILGHCILKSISEFKEILSQMYSAPDFENENEEIRLIPQENIMSFFENLYLGGESHTIEALDLWTVFMKVRSMHNLYTEFIKKVEP